MKVLIVDDDPSVLQVVSGFLEDCGSTTALAADGAEGLEVLEKQGGAGLVISDIRMPRMGGLEFLKAVRLRFPGVPVILMTGHGDEAAAITALQEGAVDYLKKPVKLRELMITLERMEERNRLEAELRPPDDRVDGQAHPVADRQGDGRVPSSQVLLVGAEGEDRFRLAEALKAAGHAVWTVSTGEEGMRAFSERTFDAAICEVDLSDGRDGIEVLRDMAASDPTLMSIALTSRQDQDTILRAMDAGLRSCVVRPFSAEDLRLRVEKCLSERRRAVGTRLLLGDLMQTRTDLQQRLALGERYLRHLIDAAPVGILSVDREGRIVTFNGVMGSMYGYAPEEVLGRRVTEVLVRDARAEDASPNPLKGPVKTTHLRKDGKSFPVLVRRREILDGRRQRIADLYMIEDLTEREQVERQLIQAEQFSLLGQLAPRIAHEFGTPLSLVRGSAEFAAELIERGRAKEAAGWLSRIVPEVERMAHMTKQMCRLGKPVESAYKALSLEAELNRTLDSLEPLGALKFCQVVRDYATPTPKVLADPSQLEQVFRNLIVNAVHAMELQKQGILTLRVKASGSGSQVVVALEDTGGGIPEEHLPKIFDPFFTTKPEGKGTGLGLSIVMNILNRHGASLRVDTEVGKGSRFTLTFEAIAEGRPAGLSPQAR